MKSTASLPNGQPNTVSQLSSLPDHNSNQLMAADLPQAIRHSNQMPVVGEHLDATSADHLPSNAPPLTLQPAIPGSHDNSVLYGHATETGEEPITGPSLAGSPSLAASFNAGLVSQAAAIAYDKTDSNDAIFADLLSSPTSINWLEELLNPHAEPAAHSLTFPAETPTQPIAQVMPTTTASSAAPQGTAVADNGVWQQQANAGLTGNNPNEPGSSPWHLQALSQPQLSAPHSNQLDSRLDALLRDLAPELDAIGDDDIAECCMAPGMHRCHASGSQLKGFLPAEQGDLPPSAMVHPSLSRPSAFLAGEVDETPIGQGMG